MDVREKLVELLTDNLPRCGNLPRWDNPLQLSYDEQVQRIADDLISNGVTVPEWISVEDMLPEDDGDVLAYSSIGEESRIYPACYSNGVWFDCVFNAPVTDTTTHWMPMPQPPKGE